MNKSINNNITATEKKNTKSDLSLLFWIKSALSFRFISNLSIIVSIFAYYTNAYDIFFHFIPLVIVNFIIIMIMQFYNLDELIDGIFQKKLIYKKDRDEIKPQFVLFTTLWHFIPLLWIMYILQTEDIIKLFHPNFMGVFLKTSLIPIIYYYFESKIKVYGNINYLAYFILYIGLLFASCVYLYL